MLSELKVKQLEKMISIVVLKSKEAQQQLLGIKKAQKQFNRSKVTINQQQTMPQEPPKAAKKDN